MIGEIESRAIFGHQQKKKKQLTVIETIISVSCELRILDEVKKKWCHFKHEGEEAHQCAPFKDGGNRWGSRGSPPLSKRGDRMASAPALAWSSDSVEAAIAVIMQSY